MIFSRIRKGILKDLKEASDTGTPTTLSEALEYWGNKNTAWNSLINDGYIYIISTAVTVTASGSEYLEKE